MTFISKHVKNIIIQKTVLVKTPAIFLKEKLTTTRESEAAPRGAFIKLCSENMQQIYRKAPIPKCDLRGRLSAL